MINLQLDNMTILLLGV